MDDGRWLVALSLGAFAVAGRLTGGSRGVARKRLSRRDDPTGEVQRPEPKASRQVARPAPQRQISLRESWVTPSPEEMLRSLDRRDQLLIQTIPRIPTL